MLLQGTYQGTLDEKGRVKIPSKLLKQLGEGRDEDFVLKLESHNNYITVYPKNDWEKTILNLMAKTDMEDEEQRDYLRRKTMNIGEVRKDNSDRLNIPNYMLEALEVDNKSPLVIHAYVNVFEIWSKSEFDKHSNRKGPNYKEVYSKEERNDRQN